MTPRPLTFLVSAGPTREHLDDVRFLSNASSGRMGYAVAAAAAAAGHRVTLVSGPVTLPPPAGVETVSVVSAEDMRARLLERFDAADAVVMTAAVCDDRPRVRAPGKPRKAAGPRTLDLEPTPDILKEMGARKRRQVLVGFSLGTDDPLPEAERKRKEKNCDLIVANTASALGAENATVTFVGSAGAVERIEDAPKRAIATRLVARVETLAQSLGRKPA
jgi:phosphopantothenoylcysteine decarboxylase/phosphopantothenate--cysteine ligase